VDSGVEGLVDLDRANAPVTRETLAAFAAECADIRLSGAKILETGRAPGPGG
jgi:hypothetical protein